MNRAFAGTGFPQHGCPSVRERILSSIHGIASTSGRCCQVLPAPTRRQGSTKPERFPGFAAAKAGKSSSGQEFKGFGAPPKGPQKSQRALTFDQDTEDEVQNLPAAAAEGGEDTEDGIIQKPAYQMYTDAGYKAQRYVGPVALQRLEGESRPVLCTTAEVLPGDLLVVSPALGFVAGGFQEVPELEDLHAAMLEDGPSAAVRRVMEVMEELRPGPVGAGAAAAASSPAEEQPQQSQRQPQRVTTLPSMSTLDVKFWSGRGRDASAPQYSSQRLRRLLSRAATSSETQDPGASQARHQKPLGYAALWPEPVLLAHSCLPNTSQLVVADRLFLHAADLLPPGTPLTRNYIGEAVTAPLSYRQRAVDEVLVEQGMLTPGQPPAWAAEEGGGLLTACRCQRCLLEASVSEELRNTLEEAYRWYVDEASQTFSQANEEEDMAMLRGLLEECQVMVDEVEEALRNEPELEEDQHDLLRASVYDVYDLLVTLDETLRQGAADPDKLQACVDLIRLHSPGSEDHLMVALKLEFLRQQQLETFGEMLRRERVGAKSVSKSDRRKLKALSQLANLSGEYRLEAAVVRYGLVWEETMSRLTEGVEAYMDGLEQMRAMQAQGMTELTREMEVDGVKVQIVDRLEVSEEARVGPGAGRAGAGGGATRVISQDGMQVMVVDGVAPAAGEGSEARVEAPRAREGDSTAGKVRVAQLRELEPEVVEEVE